MYERNKDSVIHAIRLGKGRRLNFSVYFVIGGK